MDSSFINISVLSLNIWGLPSWIASNKENRINELGKTLSDGKYDIICLQELWIEKDYFTIQRYLSLNYPYDHYFYSGVFGSGLCIFSKWPIEETFYHQWPLNGYFHMIHHGDWFGGKGVGLAVINHNGYKINVYTAHLHAQYNTINDDYVVHRAEQAFDTGVFIRLTSSYADFSILAGDLNAEPNTLCERLIRQIAGLNDTFVNRMSDSETGTYGSYKNSYSDQKLIKTHPFGERIDYIMYRARTLSVQNLKYLFPLDTRIPGGDHSYSDHEAIAALFKLEPNVKATSDDIYTKNIIETFNEAISLFENSLYELSKRRLFHWNMAIAVFCCLMVSLMTMFTCSSFSCMFIVLLGVMLIVNIVMATVWHRQEHNGILGAKNRMKIFLENLIKYEKHET